MKRQVWRGRRHGRGRAGVGGLGCMVLAYAVLLGCSGTTSEQGSGSDGSAGTSAESTGTGTTGTSTGVMCSEDMPCPERYWCNYPDDLCGTNGVLGSCVPWPLDCTAGFPQSACSCSGDIGIAGCMLEDESRLGNCELEPGTLACGSKICPTGAALPQFCLEVSNASLPFDVCWDQSMSMLDCPGGLSCDCLETSGVCNQVATGSQVESCEDTPDGTVLRCSEP